MGFRFFRGKKLTSDDRLNPSESDRSVSYGSKSTRFTVGSRGMRETEGNSGTGTRYVKHQRHSSKKRVRGGERAAIGKYAKSIGKDIDAMKDAYKRTVEGLQQLQAGHPDQSIRAFSRALSDLQTANARLARTPAPAPCIPLRDAFAVCLATRSEALGLMQQSAQAAQAGSPAQRDSLIQAGWAKYQESEAQLANVTQIASALRAPM